MPHRGEEKGVVGSKRGAGKSKSDKAAWVSAHRTVSRIVWIQSTGVGKEWWSVQLERNRDQRVCVSDVT